MTARVYAWPRHLRARCPAENPGWQCVAGICPHVNLFCCATCSGWEGCLPSDCPGRTLTAAEADAVYAGGLNYVAGAGWVRPEDRMWRAAW